MNPNKRQLLALALTLVTFLSGCRSRRPDFPGYLYVLANGTIYEISSQGAQSVRPGVQTAALSPDGEIILIAEADRTLFINLRTGAERTIADRPARKMGWNGDGSRFFLVSSPEVNQILAGDRLGAVKGIFRGARAASSPDLGAATDASSNIIFGEISGCLFLDKNTLVFSAYDGIIPPSTGDREIGANRAYRIDLSLPDVELKSMKFPADESWRFVDVDSGDGSVLIVVEKKTSGGFLAFYARAFQEWEDLSFEREIPGAIIRCANGDYDLLFQPATGFIFGIDAVPVGGGRHAVVFQFDPETQDIQSGPDLGWGDNIAGPILSSDGRFAAVLIYERSKEWRLKIVDLEKRAETTVWSLRDRNRNLGSPADAILAWMR
jgi:hypothetical protein